MNATMRFLRSEEGPTSVEYAVMLALIASVCLISIKAVGDQTSGMWANSHARLEEVGF